MANGWKKTRVVKLKELPLPPTPGDGDRIFDKVQMSEAFDDGSFLEKMDLLDKAYDMQMSGYSWTDHVDFDPLPDVPISLEQAVCLPELGGVLRNHINDSVPSHFYTVNGLRAAIAAGKLASFFKNGKDRAVTRRAIQEWIASCQDAAIPQPSNSNQSADTKTAAPKKQSGSSNITTREKDAKLSSARDTALEKARKLRDTLRGG